ncbi:MAG: hypothetical protein ACFFC9_05495 [Promethearchaeota archaeon]
MKGIIILGFKKGFEPYIDTQFPSNICEFLNVTPKDLHRLSDEHMNRKMEPNFLDMQIKENVNVASFYSGFTFRHYVGKPDFAITVFLSDDDKTSENFEGMIRRIAHELLPKREALNFDDILGQYYEMMKNEELSSYWEEIIEGETTILEGKENESVEEAKIEEKEQELESEKDTELTDSTLEIDIETLKAENVELKHILDEKATKIRELTQKYTELSSEKKNYMEEIETLKSEISEQYIKLEKWSQQMADLNENNAKLLEEVKTLTEDLSKKEKESLEKENEIASLNKNLKGTEDIEKEAKSLFKKTQELREINSALIIKMEKIDKQNKELLDEVDKNKDVIDIHMNTITNLKLELKEVKNKFDIKDEEKESIKNEIFDLKKEIKILRRERDHYKKIVKENNLL